MNLWKPPASGLGALDCHSTPGFDGDKEEGEAALAALGPELAELQELLFANGRAETYGAKVLLVLQGMDTAGKGGIVRHVAGLADPQGLQIAAFKKPTPEELDHDFLWRIEKRLPAAGMIGIFDRSHYEDVLIARVRELAPAEEIERRYGAIVDFEHAFIDAGGTLLKVFLHIDAEEQADRLAARLDDPTKHWKFNPGDLDERARWGDYQRAYEIAFERCSTDVAPWHVVPAANKWYARWAVATLLTGSLRELDLSWPAADFDVEQQKALLASSR